MTAAAISNDDFAKLKKHGEVVHNKRIDDMPDRVETIFDPGVLERDANFIRIPPKR